jgi:hypothetical protein
LAVWSGLGPIPLDEVLVAVSRVEAAEANKTAAGVATVYYTLVALRKFIEGLSVDRICG